MLVSAHGEPDHNELEPQVSWGPTSLQFRGQEALCMRRYAENQLTSETIGGIRYGGANVISVSGSATNNWDVTFNTPHSTRFVANQEVWGKHKTTA